MQQLPWKTCDFEQIGDCRWQCRRCGRTVHTMRLPDGSVMQPRPEHFPPCGWKALAVEAGGHLWVEQPPAIFPQPAATEAIQSPPQRRFRCQQCFREVLLPVEITEDAARQTLEKEPFCLNPRPQPRPIHQDQSAPAGPPGMFRQAVNYSKAVLHWFAAGRPTRPPEEIERILAICQACQYYKDGQCHVCGCRVTGDPAAWRNKIAMATETCPKGKWTESTAPVIQKLD
ncbi:MAG TPA: hypothetical protein PLQ00_17930, partial [Thermoguttaceae bacterium]|nr:hypothetical protein [Thermoguttaceae bacterium]